MNWLIPPNVTIDPIAVSTSGSAGAVTSCSPAVEEMSAAAPLEAKTARPTSIADPSVTTRLLRPATAIFSQSRTVAEPVHGAVVLPETSMT